MNAEQPSVGQPLSGLTVIVTRPGQRAGGLVDRLVHAGARVIRFPLLGIEPLDTGKAGDDGLDCLADADLIVFLSQNAVDCALTSLGGELATLSHRTRIGAIGAATARALKSAAVRVQLSTPAPYTSETLLRSLAAEELAGRTVVLIAGEGGRETLRKGLESRGAVVRKLAVYRRIRPRYEARTIRDALVHPTPALVLVSSGEALTHLIGFADVAGGLDLSEMPILVPSTRVAGMAASQGLGVVRPARDATDEAMFKAALLWGRELLVGEVRRGGSS